MGIRSTIFRRALNIASGSSGIKRRGGVRAISNAKMSRLFRDNSVGRAPRFDEGIWEEGYTEVIEAQESKAGNAGQTTLLTEYFPQPAKEYCKKSGETYDAEEFVSFVKNDLGDDYYYAINEIIDECAEELYEIWDRSYSNEGVGEKLFGLENNFSGRNRVYGNFSNAIANYTAAATARGYDFSGSAAGNARNRELNRQSLIKRFGTGPTKAWNTSNYYASASYVNAAKKNGKNL